MDSATVQFDEIKLLEEKLTTSSIPAELRKKAKAQIDRLVRISQSGSFSQEYDSVSRYLDWVVSLPWANKSQDNLSLENAKKILDKNHYGLSQIKERILEYISVVNLKQAESAEHELKAPALLFLGLVGTGKTTMAYSIAEALGRKFGRIPMGGMGDALQLRGRARAYPDAEPGQIVKVLRRAGTKNPVILLDEIDRVTEDAKADIMGVLVELLDPEQNSKFLDHFIDYPIDLSEVLFISTANNTGGVATAVLDRMEVMELPSYTDEEKIIIAKNYLLPREIPSAGLKSSDITIAEDVWPQIVRPLGFDAGMRTLDRTIAGICRKIAKMKLEKQIASVSLTSANLKEYLPTW